MKTCQAYYIFLLIVLLSCNKSIITFNEQKIKRISVTKQSTFEINLTSTPPSGYNWYISEKSDTTNISLISKETIKEKKDEIMVLGGSVDKVLKFKANKKGKADIILYYKRQWENKPPLDSIYYKIKIK